MATEEPEAKGSREAEPTATAPGRLGGARADFVASLGRKVADARVVLASLEGEPTASQPRDDLRRKLHALGAAARMLHFEAMAKAIAEAEGVLDRVAKVGSAKGADLAHLSQALDDLPALAWGESPPREPPPKSVPDAKESGPALPRSATSALIVGGEPIADALTEEGESGESFFECERTELAKAALGLARALAPDVVVVDSDVEGALNLVESLLDDPLTEPVPIIVLGNFRAPEQAARFVALGVAKTLAKPVSPGVLRRACQEVVDQREGRTVRVTLGEPTLEQLGERLADEVRRALVDSVDATSRSVRVPLGEGTEVLGAVWGAIARVREVITMRTDGVVRYTGAGPEGAVAMAPWLHHDVAGTDRVEARGRGAAADVSLDRRRVIVADDDPGVTWFISDLLRTTGCSVHEALDGKTALELAYEYSPELVVSDILMPGMDGFALCRALKRDVALRDTPVILLSWKEDLLQRVRELGASAAAYLRKESDARAIVARVREVLRPRARVEARLRGEGEVRGRLDGLTVRSLLELVCLMRPSSRVSVRDASFLYEVEIRDGAPRRATRTAGDGSYQRGERVLAAVLGVGAGRFVVTPSSAGIPSPDLAGSLASQLARPIALARGAQQVTTGAGAMLVEKVVLDEESVSGYLLATPQPARDLVKRIAQGASPREMLLRGDVAPSLLEDVLADLASRGTITAVFDLKGNDLLTSAVERALAAAKAPPPERAPARPSASDARTPYEPRRTPSPIPASDLVAREIPAIADASKRAHRPGSRGSDAPTSARSPSVSESAPPSSLEDAVMRAMSDRSPSSGAQRSSQQPPIVEPSELRPRSSNPPAGDDGKPMASLPPDAIVPGASSGDMPAAQAHPDALYGELTSSERIIAGSPLAQKAAVPAAEKSIPISLDSLDTLSSPGTDPSATAPSTRERERVAAATGHRDPSPRPLPAPAPSMPPARERRWRFFAVLVAVALVVAAGIRWSTPARNVPVTTPGDGTAAPTATTDTAIVTFADLPAGVSVPQGNGLLELNAPPGVSLRLDGAELQRGGSRPVRMAMPAGPHEVRVTAGPSERHRAFEIRAGRTTHIDFAEAP